MAYLKRVFIYIIIPSLVGSLSSCGKSDKPGLEFAPNMYHSVAYEPLSQITDENAGKMVTSTGAEKGEFYNSNVNNPHAMNMRLPVKGTISRRTYLNAPDSISDVYFIAKSIHKDSIDLAGRILKNPIVFSDEVLAQGQKQYLTFCSPCHGENGQGDGLVGAKYKGIPNFGAKSLSDGNVYHTITHGVRRMWPYASQISPENRWKIVHYVKTLQKQQ